MYFRASYNGGNFKLNIVPTNSSGNYISGETYGTNVTSVSTNWVKITGSITAPAGTEGFHLRVRGINGVLPSANDTLDADSFMLTEGATSYNYADGNSSNWTWNGTSNNSTSTGPPL